MSYVVAFTTTSNLDIASFVVAGLTLDTPPPPADSGYPSLTGTHVMASIASLDQIGSDTWDDIFGVSEISAASDIHAFLKTILSAPNDFKRPTVLQPDIYYATSLYESSVGYGPSGDVSIMDITPATVPLPNACLMGGGLVALMALSKRSVKWRFLRQPEGLF
jgi:hypothetical protein